MEIVEKKNKNKKYKPILEAIPDWPVYKLSKNRKEFIEEVAQRAYERIKSLRPTPKQLVDELEATVYREQQRMKRNRWRVDPEDEPKFWAKVKEDLNNIATKTPEEQEPVADFILKRIVSRYADEIAGNFKPSQYRLTREIVKFWFARLLNGARVKKFGAFWRNQYTLRDKIHIVGKVKLLRKLARKGTVVMVPTHFSNLDSILIGWVIHSLGLPAFIYGAGLNLFNLKIFAYFMNSLGAYKVDRRKKNTPYLETLKLYSTIALEKGAHSLFFPGGTRSRSGMIEKQLKLGLLGSTIEAQRNLYMQEKPGETAGKIFIVPVTLNYHFVLEAPDLVEEYLSSKGQDKYMPEQDRYGSWQLIQFLFKFFTKGSSISVSIGRGLDIMGNYVDEDGNSIDEHGRVIDTRDYFVSNGALTADKQREDEYTRMLSQKIVKEYHRINRVFASHLVAYVAFNMWLKKHPKLDLFGLLRLPEEELQLPYEEFRETCKKVRKQIYRMKVDNKLNIASHLKGDIDEVIKRGLYNVGIFHLKRPLLRNRDGNIITQDLNLLYYYHNRLVGYELDQFIG
ncbi:MAG: 1-acyl-sn-glycerol-3-phosphate acyltransferase [Cyclobacteriaceae bacterium]|jgi:glycerol-3-phosphate O-acyltransferase|nr:1-acyl-sn-glycerol-3-phosphate acyltransferase [Flammeovirgaceae bacterium]MCZ8022287.1 1-acyl-sn-glycerol-3-phosphate acyltransferase [Cytophagales bacterium]MCZ8326592.1 1-acyl-sn-glycerol-3-phosphate acyltransferase [Cyclobacteriaceae bacterium]